jgi:hypothetical protein
MSARPRACIQVMVAVSLMAVSRGSAQTADTMVSPLVARGVEELARGQFVDWTAQQGSAALDGSAYVSGATTIRGFALSLGGNSTFMKYSLPLKFTLSPFALTNTNVPAVGWMRRLRDSNVEVQYKTVTFAPHQDPAVGQAVSANYKIPLLGTKNIDDADFELNSALARAFDDLKGRYVLPESPNLIDPAHLTDLTAGLNTVVRAQIAKLKGDLARQFQVAVKPGYTRSWLPKAPDQASLAFSASKGVGPTTVATVSADGSLTHFLPLGSTPSYDLWKLSGSAAMPLQKVLALGLQFVVNHNTGAGFTGISGVADTTKTDEMNLGQSLVLNVSGGVPITFSVQENHFGTGSHDVSASLDVGYKFPFTVALKTK